MAAAEADPAFLSLVLFDDLFVAPCPRGIEMDPRVWKCFPVDLLEAVLVWLPASSQARFQAVSKSWLKLLTSQPFRKRTAELAFSSCQYVCGVRNSMDKNLEPADEYKPRYKVHKLSLLFLPSQFQSDRCNLRFHQGLMVVGLPDNSHCVVNLANQTWRALPKLPRCSSPDPVISVSESQDGAASFCLYFYVNDVREEDWLLPRDGVWNVYRSTSNAWERMVIKLERPEYAAHMELVCVREESVHIVTPGSYSERDCTVHDRRSGDFVRRLPPWQEEGMLQLSFMMRRDEQPVALGFSTSGEKLCEVCKVDESNTAWVKWAVMPHGVLWSHDDAVFFAVWKVEIVGIIAFLTFIGHDRPVYSLPLFAQSITKLPRSPLSTKLVAFDLVQASWKVLDEQWSLLGVAVFQLKPDMIVSWTNES